MINIVGKYYHTIKHLKWNQIKYRLLYLIPSTSASGKTGISIPNVVLPNKEFHYIPLEDSWRRNNTFQFLNLEKKFKNSIDWNYSQLGKLWTYNLTYFDFLTQKDISKEEGLTLIYDFIDQQNKILDGMEPYPISLRTINWIKFLLIHQVNERKILESLFFQLQRLSARPEYHLQGNHLLENGFSLFIGGLFFAHPPLINQGKKILANQLTEQILTDGGHFELSPMYHSIILHRLLDTVNLIKHLSFQDEVFINFLMEKGALMSAWLEEIKFEDDSLPNVNDSIDGIAASVLQLLNYARVNHVESAEIRLKDSGYRKFKNSTYELLVDVGNIGPDYIPGHAHSDTLNFILYDALGPLIVDTGISTYEKNQIRNDERSTSAHNTVMVGGKEQSEVWGGFRVAKRAKIVKLVEEDSSITAAHNGYHDFSCTHQRKWTVEAQSIRIEDNLSSNEIGTCYLHFHHDLNPLLSGSKIQTRSGIIEFHNASSIHLEPYDLALGFNKKIKATKAVIQFQRELLTVINFK